LKKKTLFEKKNLNGLKKTKIKRVKRSPQLKARKTVAGKTHTSHMPG